MPKGKAATPLKGPITKGTGKALIARAGGGRKALKTFRSQPRAVRKGITAGGGPRGRKLLDLLADVRFKKAVRTRRAKAAAKAARR